MCRKLRVSPKIFRSQPIPIEKMSRSKRVKHGKFHILTLFCMSYANIFKIEPEISANVTREIFVYFTYHIDVNVTLHTFKLKMAVKYEIVIKFAVN